MENTANDYLEYMFLTEQYQILMSIESSINQNLEQEPKNVTSMLQLSKVRHDKGVCEKILKEKGIYIFQNIESKYAVEFKFLLPEDYRKQ